MKRQLPRVVSSIFVTATFVTATFANVTLAAAQNAPTVEVSGGYNFLRILDDELEDEKNVPAGWYADVAGALTPQFAVVGQVSGNYKTYFDSVDAKYHTFMGGVRVSSRSNARVVPFAQILAGGVNLSLSERNISDSETDGALQFGGGVNVMPRTNIGVRLGVDYVRVFTEDEGTNVFRFAAGVVVGLGGR